MSERQKLDAINVTSGCTIPNQDFEDVKEDIFANHWSTLFEQDYPWRNPSLEEPNSYQFIFNAKPCTYLTLDQMEELAGNIRIKTGHFDDNVVDVIDIAKKLGYKVFEVNFNDNNISGMVDNAEKAIYINSMDSYVRKRFTIAHELAHVLLNHVSNHIIDYRKYYEGYNSEEYQANMLASTLLMPKDHISKYWDFTKNLSEIANVFSVSKAAVAIRLIQLGLLEDE